ncbi:hypothetical protein L9F63_004884 [Diploptera punctata]|uniref:BZIP domain-containing protein n=1 Tax=Diploptera punctata TaxID=6984 RepID=A0AAD7ZDV6_DIPPU|nr:hypothetical protein L9F63_004884 [Diploptera punctata]
MAKEKYLTEEELVNILYNDHSGDELIPELEYSQSESEDELPLAEIDMPIPCDNVKIEIKSEGEDETTYFAIDQETFPTFEDTEFKVEPHLFKELALATRPSTVVFSEVSTASCSEVNSIPAQNVMPAFQPVIIRKSSNGEHIVANKQAGKEIKIEDSKISEKQMPKKRFVRAGKLKSIIEAKSESESDIHEEASTSVQASVSRRGKISHTDKEITVHRPRGHPPASSPINSNKNNPSRQRKTSYRSDIEITICRSRGRPLASSPRNSNKNNSSRRRKTSYTSDFKITVRRPRGRPPASSPRCSNKNNPSRQRKTSYTSDFKIIVRSPRGRPPASSPRNSNKNNLSRQRKTSYRSDFEDPDSPLFKRVRLSSVESDTDKYRELRDRNNEASRRSRLNTKIREVEMKETAQRLEKENHSLRIRAEQTERLVKKLKEALLESVAKDKSDK